MFNARTIQTIRAEVQSSVKSPRYVINLNMDNCVPIEATDIDTLTDDVLVAISAARIYYIPMDRLLCITSKQ